MTSILFISQYFYPEQFSNNAIAQELVRRGHSVVAVPCVPNYPQGVFFDGYSNSDRRDETWNGVKIRRVRTISRGRSAWRLALNYFSYPFFALLKIATSDAKTADVSFVSMPSPLFQALVGIWARRIWRVPTVYWVQDLWPETVRYIFNLNDGLLLKLLDAICGWIYRRADLVMVQSPAMIPFIERHGVARSRIRVLHNTAPPIYKPLDRNCSPEIAALMPPGKFCLLFAGNVGESQGLELLVEAAYRIRHRDDIAYIIVGDGRALPALKDKVLELNLKDKFTFCGQRMEREMPQFFACADALFVCLRPFPNFELTVPYKLQTYLACERPILASISGEGARVVKEAGAGLACESGDAAALADAIERLADMRPSERREMGLNARLYFEKNYSPDVVYGVLEEALDEVSASRRLSSGA